MKEGDIRELIARYFIMLDEWRKTRSDIRKQQMKRIEERIKGDNERYFHRIERNRQQKLPM